jgi:hypothetical protein
MRGNIRLFLAILFLVLLTMSACAITGSQQATETVESSLRNNIPTSTPDPIKDPVIISTVDSIAGLETITVTNISDIPQDITGFSLLIPNTSEYIDFPETKLEPGASLKIYNGPDAKLMTDGIIWRDQVTLKISGDYIILLNRAGRALWYYTKL